MVHLKQRLLHCLPCTGGYVVATLFFAAAQT